MQWVYSSETIKKKNLRFAYETNSGWHELANWMQSNATNVTHASTNTFPKLEREKNICNELFGKRKKSNNIAEFFFNQKHFIPHASRIALSWIFFWRIGKFIWSEIILNNIENREEEFNWIRSVFLHCRKEPFHASDWWWLAQFTLNLKNAMIKVGIYFATGMSKDFLFFEIVSDFWLGDWLVVSHVFVYQLIS